MKSKLLFLPDIFLVVLICLSCERTDMQANRKAVDYQSTSYTAKGGAGDLLYSAEIKDQLNWENMVDLARTKLGKLKNKSIQD